ncbi:hypothetical protein AMTRI_Chr08g205180 [Amborella trichopoda]
MPLLFSRSGPGWAAFLEHEPGISPFHMCLYHAHMPPSWQWDGLSCQAQAWTQNLRAPPSHAHAIFAVMGWSGPPPGDSPSSMRSLRMHSPRRYRPGWAFFVELEPDHLLSLTSHVQAYAHFPSPIACSSLMRAVTPTIPSEPHRPPLTIPNGSHHLTTHHSQWPSTSNKSHFHHHPVHLS